MPKMEVTKEDAPDLKDVCSDSSSISSAVVSESSFSKMEESEHNSGTNPVSFCVQGIYARLDVTDEEYESEEREFICCRYRMQTRPFDKPSYKDSTVETDVVDKSSSRSEKEPHDDQKETDNTERNSGSEENEEEEDEGDKDVNEDGQEYETAMFIPEVGLVGSEFWHEYDESIKDVRGERAVLFQSQENYEQFLAHKRFESCFDDIDYMETPTFGEQVIVSGIGTSDIAIGDVFEIEGGHSPLVVEITSPRKPCEWLNQKNGTKNGKKGIANYSHHNLMAGWFARVLVAGELLEGMQFVRKEHPNPKWTLNYIHKALYGEGNKYELKRRHASWNRGREELEELVALPQLGEFEWKIEGRKLLLKFDGKDWNDVRIDLVDPQQIAPTREKILTPFRVGIILEVFVAVLIYWYM